MVTVAIDSQRRLRILVVEDNYLTASHFQRVLQDMGFEVVGPAVSVEQGLALAENEPLDGAILDIDIIGGNSTSIAGALHQRGCPFIFISAHYSTVPPATLLLSAMNLSKPVTEIQIVEAVLKQFLHRTPPPR